MTRIDATAKTRFVEVVRAATAEEAFRVVGAKYGKTRFAELRDSPAQVRAATSAKLVRARENASLYADQVAYLEAALARFDAHDNPERAVVDLILDHGDVRVDQRAGCLVRLATTPGHRSRSWFVFGYHFC